MATAGTHSVAIEIDDDIKARVEHLADVRHRPAHALIQDAISQYVEREEKRDAWLAQLEQGNDIEPPECHG